ncbi:hypothetical protein GCT13_39495 [Paraburkholderia sp. CNPSo 3157]|uniref:Uncharacterized protein n=1 Tax=Paraburkholderia franconis TaxID=2654983 RepID=A0A7X1NJC5_9BURK|nr:hypothetical protein [Paraburkholderia franconis]MPW22731.1 hypothetical protein [Paraburkholderia franconis]
MGLQRTAASTQYDVRTFIALLMQILGVPTHRIMAVIVSFDKKRHASVSNPDTLRCAFDIRGVRRERSGHIAQDDRIPYPHV